MNDFIFVNDFFLEDYSGGAELSLEALIELCKDSFIKLRSFEVNKNIINKYKDKFWIFGNTSNITKDDRFYIIKNIKKYVIIEYDYKICKFRLPQLHKDEECDCIKEDDIKLILLWYSKSKINWFMSKKQLEYYIFKFPKFKNFNNIVLGSTFSNKDIDYFNKNIIFKKNNTWLIQNLTSWVKGYNNCIEFANNNNLNYYCFENLSREKMLDLFTNSKGFIFLPNGFDTCPRTVIEAKLLGCELVLNDFVQHTNENWFESKEKIIDFLKINKYYFWDKINEIK